MLKKFIPNAYYKNLSAIDPNAYKAKGYKIAIFDFDNTLASHGSRKSSDYANQQIEKWQNSGFIVAIISNTKQDRADDLAKDLPIDIIGNAQKPGTTAFEKIQDMFKVSKSEMIYFGDQIFTDVWAANNYGIEVVLLDPLNKEEPSYIKVKRFLEKIVKILIGKNEYFDDIIA